MKYAAVRNHIGGAFVSADLPTLDVYDPAAGVILSRVPLTSGARWTGGRRRPGGLPA
jgi:hypothetical protein